MVALGGDSGLFAGVEIARGVEVPMAQMLTDHPEPSGVRLEIELGAQMRELVRRDPNADVAVRAPGDIAGQQYGVDMSPLLVGEEPRGAGAAPPERLLEVVGAGPGLPLR